MYVELKPSHKRIPIVCFYLDSVQSKIIVFRDIDVAIGSKKSKGVLSDI